MYPAADDLLSEAVWSTDLRTAELAEALRSTLRDEYADASEYQMREALENILEAMSPAEAFDFGSALGRIAKGANQVLSDPTFVSVARTALPIAGQVAGGAFGGPAGVAIGGGLGNLAAGALAPGARAPAAGRTPAPPSVPPAMQPAAQPAPGAGPAARPALPPSVLGGSAAATQAAILTQQGDVLRSLLATALGGLGRREVSGIPNAQVLAQLSRLFGEAAADADRLMYLEQHTDSAESVSEAAPLGSLYADLLGADNLELAEAAEWEGLS